MKFSTFFDCMSPWAAGYKIPVASYLLFLNITDNEKAVKKGIEYKDSESDDYDNIIPPQRYQKYANDGMEINSFAYKIYNKCNKTKFTNFLKAEASGSILKKKLYNNFSEMRHELKNEHIFENQQDLFNDIADAFLEILEDAAEVYKKSPRNNPRKTSNKIEDVDVPIIKTASVDNAEAKQAQATLPEDLAYDEKAVSTSTTNDNHTEDNSVNISSTSINNISETTVYSTTNNITLFEDNRSNETILNTSSKSANELVGLKDLINKLNSLFMDLDEKGRSIHMSSWLYSEEEQNEKEQDFETIKSDFINENKKLRHYYLNFSELKESFEEMISLSRTLTFWYGFNNDEQNHTRIVCDHQIEEYRKCIDAVWEVLSK